ncbi:unnamed protein product [Soboliphyme baturini]|uniref:Uncharacterized protein n=1 Tax=Soboliphyme baturini TaxID=241478 RepID=A0A183IT76_9BILA|nr:unnamed protein product [Soboliphyme baturini]
MVIRAKESAHVLCEPRASVEGGGVQQEKEEEEECPPVPAAAPGPPSRRVDTLALYSCRLAPERIVSPSIGSKVLEQVHVGTKHSGCVDGSCRYGKQLRRRARIRNGAFLDSNTAFSTLSRVPLFRLLTSSFLEFHIANLLATH